MKINLSCFGISCAVFFVFSLLAINDIGRLRSLYLSYASISADIAISESIATPNEGEKFTHTILLDKKKTCSIDLSMCVARIKLFIIFQNLVFFAVCALFVSRMFTARKAF
jgi:hypothetical protein